MFQSACDLILFDLCMEISFFVHETKTFPSNRQVITFFLSLLVIFVVDQDKIGIHDMGLIILKVWIS